MEKNFSVSLAILLLISLRSHAQLSENFNDGNFIATPVWIGDTSSFVINNSLQLQSNHSIANSRFALVTENKLCTSTQWEYWINSLSILPQPIMWTLI